MHRLQEYSASSHLLRDLPSLYHLSENFHGCLSSTKQVGSLVCLRRPSPNMCLPRLPGRSPSISYHRPRQLWRQPTPRSPRQQFQERRQSQPRRWRLLSLAQEERLPIWLPHPLLQLQHVQINRSLSSSRNLTHAISSLEKGGYYSTISPREETPQKPSTPQKRGIPPSRTPSEASEGITRPCSQERKTAGTCWKRLRAIWPLGEHESFCAIEKLGEVG